MSLVMTPVESPLKVASPPSGGPLILSGVWQGVRGWLFELDEMLFDVARQQRLALRRAARFLAAKVGFDTRVAAAVATRVSERHGTHQLGNMFRGVINCWRCALPADTPKW